MNKLWSELINWRMISNDLAHYSSLKIDLPSDSSVTLKHINAFNEIVFTGSLDVYTFNYNNPTNAIDYLGLRWFDFSGCERERRHVVATGAFAGTVCIIGCTVDITRATLLACAAAMIAYQRAVDDLERCLERR